MNTVQALARYHELVAARPAARETFPLAQDHADDLAKLQGKLDAEGVVIQVSDVAHLAWIACQSDEWAPSRVDLAGAFVAIQSLCDLARAVDFAHGEIEYLLAEHRVAEAQQPKTRRKSA